MAIVEDNKPEYNSWLAMRHRCRNPKVTAFKNYGGRGITVCDRWHDSFADFLADMGKRPTLGHTLDRIDNDGNYEPGNCRWATWDVQSKNRRTLPRSKPTQREQKRIARLSRLHERYDLEAARCRKKLAIIERYQQLEPIYREKLAAVEAQRDSINRNAGLNPRR